MIHLLLLYIIYIFKCNKRVKYHFSCLTHLSDDTYVLKNERLFLSAPRENDNAVWKLGHIKKVYFSIGCSSNAQNESK
jgi:hypothetical protein